MRSDFDQTKQCDLAQPHAYVLDVTMSKPDITDVSDTSERNRVIKAKAKARLEKLSFYTKSNMPAPLLAEEASNVDTVVEIQTKDLDLSTGTKMSVFSDEHNKEGLRIAERRVLSVMSARDVSSVSNREDEQEENPVDRLRKLPKVVNGQYVWETLSEADKSHLFE